MVIMAHNYCHVKKLLKTQDQLKLKNCSDLVIEDAVEVFLRRWAKYTQDMIQLIQI